MNDLKILENCDLSKISNERDIIDISKTDLQLQNIKCDIPRSESVLNIHNVDKKISKISYENFTRIQVTKIPEAKTKLFESYVFINTYYKKEIISDLLEEFETTCFAQILKKKSEKNEKIEKNKKIEKNEENEENEDVIKTKFLDYNENFNKEKKMLSFYNSQHDITLDNKNTYQKKHEEMFGNFKSDQFLEERNLYNIELVEYRKKVKKHQKACDLLNDQRVSYLYDNPSLNIEIRFNEHAISLNSTFLNPLEKDRSFIAINSKVSDYYNLSNLSRDENGFVLSLEAKKTNQNNEDKRNELLFASYYFSNQNDEDAYQFATILEKMGNALTEPVYKKIPLSKEKIYTKSISQRTLNWIKTQRWFLKKQIIEQGTNNEQLINWKLSDNVMDWMGFFNQKDLNKEKMKKQMMNINHNVKTTNYITMMLNRFTSNKSTLFGLIEEIKIDFPDKVFTEELYTEDYDGNTISVIGWVWTVKYTENMNEYLEKYTVVLPKEYLYQSR